MTREKFHAEIDELKEDVLKMGTLAREMMCDSVQALKERDMALADSVTARKEELADMDEDIERKALRMIALYQPMAVDLRTIACSLKMITYLNRIGRYGKDIAMIAREFEDRPHIKKLVSIPYMIEIVCGMVSDALKAYRTDDVTLLKTLEDRDADLDAMRYSIYRECLSYMFEDPRNIRPCTDYIMVARYLERCGDHACKMGEKIHYMVTGERIEIK